tara:strand:- start:5926 stop:7623 length:1698 start_codon:yes stop_codon:yes gene_type:complete
MTDMAKFPGLRQRGKSGVWYLRRVVPTDLRDHLEKREVLISLGTADRDEARRLYLSKWAEFDEYFTACRKEVNENSPAAVRPLSQPQMLQLVRRYVARKDEGSIDVGPLFDTNAIENQVDDERMALMELENPQHPHHFQTIDAAVREALALTEQPAPRGTTEYDTLLEYVRLALVELHNRRLRRLTGDKSFTHIDALFNPQAKANAVTLKQAADDWLEDYKDSHDVKAKMTARVEGSIGLILEFFGGDALVKDMTSKQCKSFRNMLNVLPPHRHKKYPKKSLKQVLQIAEDKSLSPLSYETQSQHLSTLKNILGQAVSDGVIATNPAQGVDVKAKKPSAEDRRMPFTNDELMRIFNAPLYTGCIDDGWNYKKRGPNYPKRGRFWVPLIALYTGMRLNELCQLRVIDIKTTEAGTPYLIAADDEEGMSLKNTGSRRSMPIHPDLVRMGLLDYHRKTAEAGHKQLFPELTVASTGYRSDNFSKWFSAGFLPSVNAKKPGGGSHVFRHNFRDALRRIEAPTEIAERLGGWKDRSVQASYGAGYDLDHLARHLNKVTYPGLDLSHLYMT